MPSPYNGMINNFHVSRLGRKVAVDDQKMLIALPRDVIPERTWAEILQKEDTELMVLEMREEIVESALQLGFERYMQRQTVPFVAHCAAQAWLKLIDWQFYRHDPGEDPTAYPPCFIPRRADSWVPDEMPEPSPKDSWAQHSLNIVEEIIEGLKKATSSESIDAPVVEEIPRECWFPGKVQLSGYMADSDYEYDSITYDETVSSDMAADSELLQKVTNYSPEDDISITESVRAQSVVVSVKASQESGSPTSLRGAGDALAQHSKTTKISSFKSKTLTRSSLVKSSTSQYGDGDAHAQSSKSTNNTLTSKSKMKTCLSWAKSSTSHYGDGDAHAQSSKSTNTLPSKSKTLTRSSMGRSTTVLPPIGSDSRSRGSLNSDRRLRGLRLETQYEIASEKMDTPPKVNAKRK